MKKGFWENPYQHHLVTQVTEVNGDRVLFAETIAFSFSGGQESDKATVNGLPVLSSEIKGQLIYYTLPANHGLLVNDAVTMEIDWTRRYRLMRLHFAAELVLEIVTRKYGFEKIGAHIAEEKSRIDFVADHNITSYLPEILSDYNKIIEQDLPIVTGYSDEANQRRYWEIEGYTRVPCGGTHVKSTGEVGFVTLKRVNVGGGKERIEIRMREGE